MKHSHFSTSENQPAPKTVEVNEFLETLVVPSGNGFSPNIPKQEMTRQLFTQASELTERIRASQPRIPGIAYTESPQLLIKVDEILDAECVFTAIKVSSGLIEASLKLPHPNLNNTTGDHPHRDIEVTNPPNMLFCWTIAHEYSHIVRRHDEISRVVENDALTRQALEYDADLWLSSVSGGTQHVQSRMMAGREG